MNVRPDAILQADEFVDAQKVRLEGACAGPEPPAAPLVNIPLASASGSSHPFAVSTSNEPPKLVRRWESLSTPVQAAIVFPLLAVVFFFLNLVGFNQPVWRSILYGLIESAPFTALVLVASANERRKRSGR